MKTASIVLFIFCFFHDIGRAQVPDLNRTNVVTLWSHGGRWSKYEWLVPEGKLLAQPKWQVGAQPPLSIQQAVATANKWMTGSGYRTHSLTAVTLRIIQTGDGKEPQSVPCFYVVNYDVGVLDSMLCVILMDGTAVMPEKKPVTSSEGRAGNREVKP